MTNRTPINQVTEPRGAGPRAGAARKGATESQAISGRVDGRLRGRSLVVPKPDADNKDGSAWRGWRSWPIAIQREIFLRNVEECFHAM
jgi:hypothetical protein